MDEAMANEKSRGEKSGSDGHGGYLVTENGKHLPTERNGKVDRGLCGAAWAALHGGYRGNKFGYTADGKPIPGLADKVAKAKNRLIAIYRKQGWPLPGKASK